MKIAVQLRPSNGRLTKWKGKVASISPTGGRLLSSCSLGALALATGLAMPTLFVSSGAGFAGTCVETSPGVFSCSGPADAGGSDAEVVIDTGGAVSVETAAGFGNDTTTGTDSGGSNAEVNGIDIQGTGGVTFTDTNSSTITGQHQGLSVRNSGGTVTVVTTGAITGLNSTGIALSNTGLGSGSTIDVGGDVTGRLSSGGTGISANNSTGALTISTAAGTTISAGGNGIRATNGNSVGVNDFTITTGGRVIGSSNYAIDATQQDDGDLVIQTSDTVIGGAQGIRAQNANGGNISIVSTAAVEGTSQAGIFAFNQSISTGDVSISATSVTSNVTGISVTNNGTGLTRVTTSGVVDGGNAGILAVNTNAATGVMEIDASDDVTGGQHAISADNRGSGALNITVSDIVTGGTSRRGDGIRTLTVTGGATATITLNAGADVRGGSGGFAISNDGGNSETLVNTGASVAGDISLGDGSDNLTFAGGSFDTDAEFNGGDDIDATDGSVDVLTFVGSSGSLGGGNIENWEQVNIGAGSAITLDNFGMTAGTTTVDVGGTLSFVRDLFTFGGAGIFDGGNLTNAGTVTLQNGTAADTVTVSGDYTGGGRLLIDVDFAADTADTLTVQGAVSGVTSIEIADVSTTTASGNEILVVDTDGLASPSDAFALATGPVTSGAFLYDLEQDTTDLDWYLRSTGQLSSTGAIYEGLPLVLAGFNSLPTMQQRVRQRSSIEGQELWVRFVGDRLDTTPSSSDDGISYESAQTGLQAGADFDLETNGIGRWVVGATMQYGQISADMSGASGTGQIDADGYGIGATGTWFSGTGLYLDFQGQANWISSDIASSAAGTLATGHDSQTLAISSEIGQRITLAGGGTLTPQAQMIWGMVDGDAMTDEDGNAVDPGANDTLVTRLGLAYETDVTDRGQFNAISNIWHDLSGAQTTNVAGADLSAEAESTWAEIGIGGDLQLGSGQSLYGEASYRTALGGASSDNRGLRLSAGFRMDF